jgi:hypothetical protein
MCIPHMSTRVHSNAQDTITELIKKNPNYKPPPDYRPPKKYRKIFIPVVRRYSHCVLRTM